MNFRDLFRDCSLALQPCAVLLAPLVFMTSAIAADYEPDRIVVYKSIEDVELKLHVFEPASHKKTDRAPAIIFFFGGGWSSGNPKQFFQQARELSDLGMVAFSAEYRIRKVHGTSPFECVADGKSAIRWVRLHAAELGVDPNRVVASGGSAGGHVAACTGVIQGHEGDGEDVAVSSVPNAMILFNPVLDTTANGYGLKQVGKDRQTEISPCHHVRAGIAPTLVLHGTDDETVPFENPERFARLMNQSGNVCQLESFPGQGHGFFNGTLTRPDTKDLAPYKQSMQKSVDFLKKLGMISDEAVTDF